MKEHLIAHGVHPKKIAIIPNFADGTLITPVAREENPLRVSWGLGDSFVVAYSGNLGRAHDYFTLIDAIALLEKDPPSPSQSNAQTSSPPIPRILWLFIGGGALYEAFRTEITKRGLTSVRFEPYQPRERLAQSLSAGDVHLVSLRPELEGLIVPSKFYGIAAAGRPTIFIGHAGGWRDRASSGAERLWHHGCEGDGVGLANAILALADAPQRALAMGKNARAALEKHWDKKAVLQRWRALLEESQ